MESELEISVVAPAYNEQECLAQFVERTDAVLRSLEVPYELIVVNDGSRDRTRDVAAGLTARYPRLRVLNLSRNFGHEMASTAGLDAARGNAVVLIDADLQDPPELIPQLIAQWRRGFQVVYAQRRSRAGETAIKRTTSWLYYRTMRWATGLDMPRDTGDFRLLDRRVVDAFRRMGERHRMVRGMITWLGFRQTAVLFDRNERFAGETKYDLPKLVRLALDSLFSFTTKPLRLATRIGATAFALSLLGFVYIAAQKLFPGLGELAPWLSIRSPGYALLMCSLFLVSGVQSMLLGILGEYLARIYEQVQGRPLYVVGDEISRPQQDVLSAEEVQALLKVLDSGDSREAPAPDDAWRQVLASVEELRADLKASTERSPWFRYAEQESER